MPQTPLSITPALSHYVAQHTGEEPVLLKNLREYFSKHHPQPHMMTPVATAQLLSLLVRIHRPSIVLEVGTFVGYSTLSLALAMGDHGHLHTCDQDNRTLAESQVFWKRSGVDARITFHHGPALHAMKTLAKQNLKADFFYIDADKKGYLNYLHQALEMATPGALITFDNTLSEGKVLDENPRPYVQAIQAFNREVSTRDDLDVCLLPVGDGLTLIQKKDLSG